METLDPKAAAAAIKSEWDKNPPAPEPGERHSLAFLEEVCKELGVEVNAINVSHAARLMAQANVEQHHPDEYPKAVNIDGPNRTVIPAKWPVGHAKAGTEVVLHDADEEAEWSAIEHPPEPEAVKEPEKVPA